MVPRASEKLSESGTSTSPFFAFTETDWEDCIDFPKISRAPPSLKLSSTCCSISSIPSSVQKATSAGYKLLQSGQYFSEAAKTLQSSLIYRIVKRFGSNRLDTLPHHIVSEQILANKVFVTSS